MRGHYGALRERVRRWAADPRFSPARVMRALGQEDDAVYRLPVDVYTTEESVVLLASVPGLRAEDLRITLDGDVIAVEGIFPGPVEHGGYVVQDRPRGPFRRAFRLNAPVEADSVTATVRDGLLTVTLPHGPRRGLQVISVQAEKNASP